MLERYAKAKTALLVLMKSFAYYILLFLLLSCKSKTIQPSQKNAQQFPISEKTNTPKKISMEEIFKTNYDISDLKNYKDIKQFVGRIIVTKRFNKILILELTEFGNAVSICVKQPLDYPNDENIDSFHSKPFNQLCYDYDEQESNKLKQSFAKYNTGQTKRDTSCKGCLDPQFYKIELFDHGRYSSLEGDILSQENFDFVSYIMGKAKVNFRDFKIQ